MSWSIVTLKEVTNLVTCGVAKRPEYVEDGVPFLSAKNVKKGEIVYEGFNCISQETHEILTKNNKPEIGDILYTRVGSVGEAAIIEKDIEFSVFVSLTLIKPKHDLIDNKYLKYLLNSEPFKARALGNLTGIGVGNLNVSVVREYPIPLPPLAEQKRIAAILEKADNIRQKRQQAIKLADDFLRSVFLDMFGDPVTNTKGFDEYMLNSISDIRSGVTKGKKINLDDSLTLPYMRVANVQDGYLDLFDVKNIVVSKNDAAKCRLQKGDVLLTEGGDPDKLGRGYIWNNEIADCVHQNHIFSVRVKDLQFVYPEFLSALISSQRGKRYFLKVGKQTTGIATINKTVLSEFMTFIPPMFLQKKYLDIKKKIDEQKANYALNDLSLFESVSQQAFIGTL